MFIFVSVAQYYEMTEFTPPISERDTDELIEIAHSNSDSWSIEAIRQAKEELNKRKISDSQQRKQIEKWENEYKDYVEKSIKEEKLRLESNKTESYKMYEMILLFIFGPIIFFKPFGFFSMTLFDLRKDNFQLKFKQRLIIFILSFTTWFFYIQYDFAKMERERMEEIEKIDISDWEKKHGYDK